MTIAFSDEQFIDLISALNNMAKATKSIACGPGLAPGPTGLELVAMALSGGNVVTSVSESLRDGSNEIANALREGLHEIAVAVAQGRGAATGTPGTF